MGCARWKGARLKDVLDKVGLKKEAVEVVFEGADGQRWSWFPGQNGGLAKVDSGFDYAANFSSLAWVA